MGIIFVLVIFGILNLLCFLLFYNKFLGVILDGLCGVLFYNIDLINNSISGVIFDIFEGLVLMFVSLYFVYNNFFGGFLSLLNKLSFLWMYNFLFNLEL